MYLKSRCSESDKKTYKGDMRKKAAMNEENQITETDIIPAFRDSILQDNTDILKEYGEIALWYWQKVKLR